jgi:hypothetical protein
MLFGGALVFGIVAKLSDGLLEFGPSMDERFKFAAEFKAIEADSDPGIPSQYASKQFLEQRALDDDRMDR